MKAAIIGAGFISPFHANAYKQLEGVELAAICDVDDMRGEAAARDFGCRFYRDIGEMLNAESPELVSVCVPTFLHEQAVTAALGSGANVLCEKPLALTMESCLSMAETAYKHKRLLMTAQVLRMWPEYMRIADETARLGAPRLVSTQRLQHASRTTWLCEPDKGGGALFDLFVHELDYVCSLFGYAPSIKSAWGSRGKEGSWRSLCVMLEWSCGTCAKLEVSNMMPKGYPFTASFRAAYPDACIEYRFGAPVNLDPKAKTETALTLYENGETHSLPIHPASQEQAFFNEIKAFAQGARTGVSPLPIEDTIAVMRLIHQVKRALEG